MAKGKLGAGTRFKSLEHELGRRAAVKDPAALAAVIGRGKYGDKKMTQLSEGGRRKRG